MALIVRIDVDRPYGRQPLARHVLSRVSSDLYFPRIEAFGYLSELAEMLSLLNERQAKAYVFFRRCTLPSISIMRLIGEGGHEIGLHLENSRSFQAFAEEKRALERHTGTTITALSKHGSGGEKYGLRHFAPYEPVTYVDWARRANMRVFLGNHEDPSIGRFEDETGLSVFPSAFWLEPAWRDTETFTIEWLLERSTTTDVVLLMHPENVLSQDTLLETLERVLDMAETRILQ